jgi:hypothetical protein
MNEMLCIEINFGKNKSDHIVVHFDDTSEELAKVFQPPYSTKKTLNISHIT